MLMSVLQEMGVATVSGGATVTGDQNPEGDYEDRELVALNREVLQKIGGHAYLPVPDDFLSAFNAQKYITSIRSILLERMAGVDRWAFKDPLTASLMPLWLRVFNTAKLAPIYVLAVRDPVAVVSSMERQYGDSCALAELVWLLRICDALYYTGGNCLIVHYEDFFSSQADSLRGELQAYIHGDGSVPEQAVLPSTRIKATLNRAAFSDYVVKNEWVKKLYLELSKCRGANFDREALMAVVLESRSAMQQFSGWSESALEFHKKLVARQSSVDSPRRDAVPARERAASAADAVLVQNAALISRVTALQEELRLQQIESSESQKTANASRRQLQEQEGQIRRLTNANAKLLVDLASASKAGALNSKLTRQVESVRQKLEVLCKKNDQLSRKLFGLTSSASFQFSRMCVLAVRQPGMNTIKLPFRALRLVLGVWAGRK